MLSGSDEQVSNFKNEEYECPMLPVLLRTVLMRCSNLHYLKRLVNQLQPGQSILYKCPLLQLTFHQFSNVL